MTPIKSKIINAYTLIEILVGITIISVLFAVGYVNFRDFSRRQALADAGKLLQGDLRLAQQLALSGQKPNDANCNPPNTLNGYYFSLASNTEYKIVAGCSAGNAGSATKDVFFPTGITAAWDSPAPVLFKVLGQGTSISSGQAVTITLTQANTNNKFTVSIGSGGEVY